MRRLTRDGTAEPVSRNQILRREPGHGNVHSPCSADHEQDWQPYPVDPYSAVYDDHTYIHTYIHARLKKILCLKDITRAPPSDKPLLIIPTCIAWIWTEKTHGGVERDRRVGEGVQAEGGV